MTQFVNLFKTIDPGWIRLEQSVKGALAYITAALITAAAVLPLASPPAPNAIVYAFLVAFITFVLVNESRPRERRRTLLLTALPFAIAPFIVSLLRPTLWFDALILLALMFASYYFRRFGMRATELTLAATFAFYFANIFSVTVAAAPWFALGALIGVASAFFWQFVIRPYDPQQYLVRAVAAFEQNAADVVEAIERQILSAVTSDIAADEVQKALRRLQASRRVIEQQLAGVTGLPNWPRESLDKVRLQLFNAEQGLERLAAGADELAPQRASMPAGLRDALAQALAALKAALTSTAAPEQMAALETTAKRMVDEAHVAGDAALPLRPAFLHISIGGAQAAHSMRNLREVAEQSRAAGVNAAGQPPTQPQPANPAPPPTTAAPLSRLHPTTVLGLQAVLASGLAMLVSYLFNLDHPNWAFWTAFIVVAGSTGESLRKIIYRVVGTVIGAVVGTLLAIVLPPHFVLIVALMMLFLFLALYTRIINYAWMVFWIVMFVALAYSLSGKPYYELLLLRPLNTFIGGVIAVLVVWYVLPIRAGDRFRKALSHYLTAVDHYLTTLVGNLQGVAQPAALDAVKVPLADAYEAVAQTFPSVALEYNPLSQARSPLTSQATVVTALHNAVERFADAVGAETNVSVADQAKLTQAIQETIHNNLLSLQRLLDHQPAPPMHRLDDGIGQVDPLRPFPMGSAEQGAVQIRDRLRALAHLGRINQAIIELGAEVQAESPPVKTQAAMRGHPPAPAHTQSTQ